MTIIPLLPVITKDGFIVGKTPAKDGLQTNSGKIIKFNSKSVWTLHDSGLEKQHHHTNLPSVPRTGLESHQILFAKKR